MTVVRPHSVRSEVMPFSSASSPTLSVKLNACAKSSNEKTVPAWLPFKAANSDGPCDEAQSISTAADDDDRLDLRPA
jgi:hypothetical protein